MRNDKLIPGAIIACIGAILLLNNFNVIDLDWMNLLHLWPVFLIMGGVNLVFAGNRSAAATIIKLAVIIAGFALLVFGHFGNRFNYWPHAYNFNFNDHDNDNDNDDDSDTTTTDSSVVKIQGNSVFNKSYSPDNKLVRLNISGGATSYTLNDTTSQLFKAETKEFYGKYEFTSTKEDSVDVLNLRMKNNKSWHFDADDDKSNKAMIRLNPNPVYDIHVEAGAAEVNFDLSKFKIKNVNLAGGAASFDIKLGQPLETTNVQVSNAASGVTINIPKDAACKITTTGFMSSDDFDGFIKKGDKNYETANFGSAKNKIIINMSGVASGFEVKRY